jgi:oxygen-independent coproporphyrinogen-3 oxidase
MINAIRREIELRAAYLEDKKSNRSILVVARHPYWKLEIARIIDTIAMHFDIVNQAEITLEANPDDLNAAKVNSLRNTAINRFSIGIQSFFEEDLKWMNRAHNQQEALASIMQVQDAGFENITCDLIYGYPLLTDEKCNNMQQLIDFEIPYFFVFHDRRK